MYMCWWCWCEETPISSSCNCNIIDRDNTTITHEWNDIVVSSPFYRVISSDSTVWVTTTTTASPNETVFDLSKPCCPDRLVSVAPECTNWWTIKDVIQVDTSWPLTWTQNWCNNWNLWFDVSKINTKDERVKWKQSCTSVYWNQLFTTWSWLTIHDNWCSWEIRLTDSPFIKPILKQYIDATQTTYYWHWQQSALPNNWWFAIYTSSYIDSWWFFINRQEYTLDPDPKPWSISDWSWVSWWFIIPKKWFYRVRMNANIWVNRWVEACRVSLAWLVWWDYRVLLNIWFANSNNYSLAEFESTNTWDSEEWRIWNWCATSDILLIDEWDIIYWLFWRMNNDTLWWPWNATTDWWIMWVFSWPFWFNPFSAWNQAPSNPEYAWTYWWIEWISDELWDTRYYK